MSIQLACSHSNIAKCKLLKAEVIVLAVVLQRCGFPTKQRQKGHSKCCQLCTSVVQETIVSIFEYATRLLLMATRWHKYSRFDQSIPTVFSEPHNSKVLWFFPIQIIYSALFVSSEQRECDISVSDIWHLPPWFRRSMVSLLLWCASLWSTLFDNNISLVTLYTQ